MKSFLAAVLVVASVAVAQDKVIQVKESVVEVQQAHFEFTPDGGCSILPIITSDSRKKLTDAHVLAQFTRRQAAPSVCQAVRGSAQKAAKLDLGVGNGAKP